MVKIQTSIFSLYTNIYFDLNIYSRKYMQIIKSFSKILIRINEKQKIRDDNCSRQETQLTHTVCVVSNKWLAMCRRALVMAPLLFNFSTRLSLV